MGNAARVTASPEFATKADIAELKTALKEGGLATKLDLANLENKLASKNDLKAEIGGLKTDLENNLTSKAGLYRVLWLQAIGFAGFVVAVAGLGIGLMQAFG